MGERTTIRQPRGDAGSEREALAGRRSPGALALSVALHVALAAVVAPVLVVPAGSLVRLFARGEQPVQESLSYVDVAQTGGGGVPAAEPTPAPPPPRGERVERDDASSPPTAPTRLVAPRETPSTLPPAAGGVPEGVAGGTGAPGDVGGAGAAAGLRPTFTDSPIWTRPEDLARRPLGLAEKIDSALAGDFDALRDSAVVAAGRRKPGDWTFERNGQKYGMDREYIRLGKIAIPTAVLGLLNLGNTQANPTQVDRERRLSQMRREIQEQAHRIQTEDDMRDVIAEIRARKDRERAARLAAEGKSGDR
ncbi:MAG TPA: hypothetical protein VFX39_07665 [Gemmatimonadaceae bacterium]|nr:hypothetical protein [Gemmatimonadaceae bacterium]